YFSLATHIGAGTKKIELVKRSPITADPSTILGRIVASRKIIEIEDATKERGYLERHPVWVASVEEDGARAPRRPDAQECSRRENLFGSAECCGKNSGSQHSCWGDCHFPTGSSPVH